MEGDLVIDVTGRASPFPRGSRSPPWLQSSGYPKPEEEGVEVNLSYTTRWSRRHPEDLNGDLAIIIPADSSGKRG